jgi:hypothetical protein
MINAGDVEEDNVFCVCVRERVHELKTLFDD